MLDVIRVRAEIGRLCVECIQLKMVLRATWTRPMGQEQRRLVRLRRELTELLVLLAFARKKLHVRSAPRDHQGTWDAAAYHEKIAMRLMVDYSTDEAAPAAVGVSA